MRTSAFIDEVELEVAGGDGGAGIVSFLRERARPFGGPNGGNGGRGGNVIAQATTAKNTLLEFRTRRRIRAGNGARGRGGDCNGANADDIIVQVPVGTRITDADSGFLHADLTAAGDTALLAAGGRGGFGNAHFKSSVNRAPRTSTPGDAGEQRRFQLELNIVADVGLLGLPNAGKSTFLRAISAARPKVAAYPFTTLAPQLGWVELAPDGDALIVADIPGLIRGAADGAGLGNRFLRHLARTALLCHLVDGSSATLEEDCRAIEDELHRAADKRLADKPRWLLVNKIDLLPDDEWRRRTRQLANAFAHVERVLPVSALSGAGVRDCVRQLLARAAA